MVWRWGVCWSGFATSKLRRSPGKFWRSDGDLRPIADRVGPTVAEIHEPLDAYPDGSLLPIYMGPLHPPAGTLTRRGAVTRTSVPDETRMSGPGMVAGLPSSANA